MTVQLPYNPNPHPPGQAPIPVWVPPPHGFVPTIHTYPPQGFARVRWDPIRRPQSRSVPPTNTTFHLFPLLPPELRLRIWAFSAPSRVIELRSWGTTRYAPVRITAHPHRLPVLFRICKESRLEAQRIYKPVSIGTSFALKVEGRSYVDWRYHPTNPAAEGLTVGTAPLPYAEPYPPARVRVCWERDVIYLGPEFRHEHLLQFFTAVGDGMELKGLRRLALGHKLWVGSEDGRWDVLRNCLYSLKGRRDVKEVIIVPDDERGALVDRWYYGKHDITLSDAEWRYKFRPDNGEIARNFVENLEEWFVRLWKDSPTPPALEIHPNHDEEDATDDETASVGTLMGDELVERGILPPEVSIKSVRRNGVRMADFKDGLWKIQEAIGDMRVWKTWTPLPAMKTRP